ncbi:MAG: hypothetical protein SV377_06755 [Halobacteria archaeon]|nr:hypothetical protein [Halobacteria archaeon]
MSTKAGEREKGDTLEEAAFVTLTVIGALIFALGVSFLVLAISLDTNPPSPYLESMQDKIILLVASIGAIVLGAGIVKTGAKIVGW